MRSTDFSALKRIGQSPITGSPDTSSTSCVAHRKLADVHYIRLFGICEDLNRVRAASNGSHNELMDELKTIPLPIVDKFIITPTSTQNAVDLFEIMKAREIICATLVASQLEPNEWHFRIEGELLADSVLNRIATGAAT